MNQGEAGEREKNGKRERKKTRQKGAGGRKDPKCENTHPQESVQQAPGGKRKTAKWGGERRADVNVSQPDLGCKNRRPSAKKSRATEGTSEPGQGGNKMRRAENALPNPLKAARLGGKRGEGEIWMIQNRKGERDGRGKEGHSTGRRPSPTAKRGPASGERHLGLPLAMGRHSQRRPSGKKKKILNWGKHKKEERGFGRLASLRKKRQHIIMSFNNDPPSPASIKDAGRGGVRDLGSVLPRSTISQVSSFWSWSEGKRVTRRLGRGGKRKE